MLGTIKTVIEAKGFGFIGVPNRPDLFFHMRDLDGSLPFNSQLIRRDVEFEAIDTVRGSRAVNIKPAR